MGAGRGFFWAGNLHVAVLQEGEAEARSKRGAAEAPDNVLHIAMPPFDPTEFWNTLFRAGLTFIAALAVAEWGRRKGLFGQKDWDAQKIRGELFRELQLKRIGVLEALIAALSDVERWTWVCVSRAVEIRRAIDGGESISERFQREIGDSESKFREGVAEVKRLCGEYGIPPPDYRDGVPLLTYLCADLVTCLEATVANAGLHSDQSVAMGKAIDRLRSFGDMAAEFLVAEQKLILTKPAHDMEVFRASGPYRPSISYVSRYYNGGQPSGPNE